MTATLFHHNDLDGVGCKIIFRQKIDKNIQSISCNYDSIDQLIDTLLKSNLPEDTEICIFDICPSKNTCEKLNEAHKSTGLKLMLIDHHETKDWVKKYSWATLDPRYCATKLVLNEIGLNPAYGTKEVQDFVNAVGAWDLWLLDSPYRKRGEDLNALFHFLGDSIFVKAFLEDIAADKNFKPFEYVLEILKRNIDHYVKRIVSSQLTKSAYTMDGEGHSFKVIFAAEHVSLVGNAILAHKDSQDLHYVVIVDPITGSCSLRSREEESINVAKKALKFGGGGHTHAAGFQTDIREPIRKRIATLLNKMEA